MLDGDEGSTPEVAYQFATACIGFAYVFVVYFVLKRAFKRDLALFQKSDS